jgi:hypothetical protein
MSRDLECRYARLRGGFSDHVCTGNTVYRASAIHAVGLLDDDLGYGYDNDLSYRLTAAGYKLAFRRDAIAIHQWPQTLAGYLRQQFGVGYGRLDVVRKHARRAGGDQVSNALMMAHAPLTFAAAVSIAVSGVMAMGSVPAAWLAAAAGAAVLTLLAVERAVVGVAACRRTGDRAALAFPLAHLARDAAWAAAIGIWCLRRAVGRTHSPAHSMRRRGRALPASTSLSSLVPRRLLAVIPAYNEADNLARVVGELRRLAPGVDVLVVNDGSTDGTADLVPSLGAAWLSMPARVGVGGAVRAGLRYAEKHGYDYVVRIDGDGQHRVGDIGRLLSPVAANQLDAVIGSRFMTGRRRPTLLRGAQALLAVCITALTRKRITDPTSGFCLFGPRAIRLLARHHPTGYAEPELILLLHRHALRVGEVPVRPRPRLKGRTSLTPARALVAFGRTLLALVIVPARRAAADWSEPT